MCIRFQDKPIFEFKAAVYATYRICLLNFVLVVVLGETLIAKRVYRPWDHLTRLVKIKWACTSLAKSWVSEAFEFVLSRK